MRGIVCLTNGYRVLGQVAILENGWVEVELEYPMRTNAGADSALMDCRRQLFPPALVACVNVVDREPGLDYGAALSYEGAMELVEAGAVE